MIRVPFNLEMAKQITNGEKEGKIVTRDGRSVRIVCWDVRDVIYPILALMLKDNNYEDLYSYTQQGLVLKDEISKEDLMLEVPEYTTFKDGDIISNDEFSRITMIMTDIEYDDGHILVHYYADFYDGKLEFYDKKHRRLLNTARFATEEEKQKFINALKKSTDPRAKNCLKMLGIDEEKPKYEFKPFDKVLVRCSEDEYWKADIFSHISKNGYYICVCDVWRYCIPYEGNEYLLGTTNSTNE